MSVSKRLRFEVFRRDDHTCRYCGATASDTKLTVDHVVPVALGGTDDPGNLVTACADCNAGKTSSHPDAPLVADVAQDAMRWAQSQKLAAAQMLEEYEARDALHREFEKRWNEWASEGKAARLPVGWQQSVDTFISAGLPMPILLECINTAMRRRNVKNHDMFRYTCGIAWRRVTELRKATAAVISPEVAERVDEDCPHKAAISMLMGQLHGIELLADQQFVTFMASGFDLYREDDGDGGDYSSWDDELKAVVQMFHVESGHSSIKTVAQNLVESVLVQDLSFWTAQAESNLRSQGRTRWSDHYLHASALQLAVRHAVARRGTEAWEVMASHEPPAPYEEAFNLLVGHLSGPDVLLEHRSRLGQEFDRHHEGDEDAAGNQIDYSSWDEELKASVQAIEACMQGEETWGQFASYLIADLLKCHWGEWIGASRAAFHANGEPDPDWSEVERYALKLAIEHRLREAGQLLPASTAPASDPWGED